MPPRKKAPAGSALSAEASNAGSVEPSQAASVSLCNPDIIGEHISPSIDHAQSESDSEPALVSLLHLVYLGAYVSAIISVLRVSSLRAAANSFLSPQYAHYVEQNLLYVVCFFYTASVFCINYRYRSVMRVVVLTALAALAVCMLSFPSTADACLSAMLAVRDRIRDVVPSSTPIFTAFEVAVYGAEGGSADKASFNYMQCLTKESAVAVFVTFALIVVTVCTVQQKIKWIFAFIVTSLSYNVVFRITGLYRLITGDSSDGACASILCSRLEDFLKCVIGSDNAWTIEAAEVVTSVLACFFCLYEPVKYVFFGHLTPALQKTIRLAYAATFSLLSVIAILARAVIFMHVSDTFGEKFLMFFFRPVWFFICLFYIEYGVSLCLLRKDSSALQYFGNFQLACSENLRSLSQWYVSKFVSNHQSLLKESNTPFTYLTAILVGILLLLLNFFDPITGQGGIEHQILEAFWLDFDIIVALSGPLTVLFVAAVYIAWLTNGVTEALHWVNQELNSKLVSLLLPPKRDPQGTAPIYLMNSIYFLTMQHFVLWWYWKDIMEFSGRTLTWLGADYVFLKGLRPLAIIFLVLLFDATFVFSRGLAHVISIFSTLHTSFVWLVQVTIRNLRIFEEKNDWMPEILAKMIITLMYVVVGFAVFENFGWEMGSLKNIFALSTLAPYFVAATTTVKDELGNTFALLTRQDLRDAKTHGKLVRLEDQEGRITKIDLNSITFQKLDGSRVSQIVYKASEVAEMKIEILENDEDHEDAAADDLEQSSPSAVVGSKASALPATAARGGGVASAAVSGNAEDIAKGLKAIQEQVASLQLNLASLIAASKQQV